MLVCWLVFHLPHWGVRFTGQILKHTEDIEKVIDIVPWGVEVTPSSTSLHLASSLMKSLLWKQNSVAREGLGEESSQCIFLQGLAVKSPTSSRSKWSAIHLAGPKHLSHLYWMREIAFRDRCISGKLATKWISIKRIPFSPGFHYKIGKFVTLGGNPLRRLKWTFGMKKKLT